jgi:hypothetical protein
MVTDTEALYDEGGHKRIFWTDTGATVINDEANNAGLTIDASQNVNLENGKILSVDVISEKASAAGVTIDGVLLKDNGITMTGALGTGGHRVTAGTDGLVLTTAHVGVVTVDSSGAKIDLVLPAVSGNAGLWYKVILIGTGNESDITTASSENKIKGTVIFHTDAAVPQVTGLADADTITFAADAVIGSMLDLWCDGTFWNLLGHGAFGGAVDKITVVKAS